MLTALNSLFINNRHLIEVVLSQVKMLSSLRLHFFAIIKISRQLLNLKTILICNFMGHAAILLFLILLMIVVEWNLRVALVR